MKTDPNWEGIPDETPLADISGLIPKDTVRNRRQLDVAEAANIAIPHAKYMVGRISRADAPFTFDWMIGLHKEMFCNVWKWAGKIRNFDLNIGEPGNKVEVSLFDFAKNIPFYSTKIDDLITSASIVHHRAVQIHPFTNGNGRWARLLANIWLRLHGSKPTEWPPTMGNDGDTRKLYLSAIKKADNGDFDDLIGLHIKFTKNG